MADLTAPASWIAAQARHLLAQQGHAWLLHGPSGLGQYRLALELARAWLCDRPGAAGACGDCPSCHAIDVRGHTDLCLLMPETIMLELGWPLAEKAQADIDEKKRKPSKEIRVEALRDAVEFAQRTSGRGQGKVVLVYPAERMNAISANALLKTLEEPAGDLRFVLASEAAHQLLPTIRSRCLGHTMIWPEAAEATAWLQQHGVKPTEVAALLRAAGGRPDDALGYAQAGLDTRAWSQLPKSLARGDAGPLANLATGPGRRCTVQAVSRSVGGQDRRSTAFLRVGRPAAARLFRRADRVVARAGSHRPDRGAPFQCRTHARKPCEQGAHGPKLKALSPNHE